MEDFFDEVENIDAVTVNDLDSLGKEILAHRTKVEEIKALQADAQAKLTAAELKMIAYLEHFGKKSYPIPEVGTFTVTKRATVTVPKDIDSKRKLLEWMRSQGAEFYLEKVSVNYQTLNSVYNEELAVALEEGRAQAGVSVIPGLEPPKEMKALTLRKGK